MSLCDSAPLPSRSARRRTRLRRTAIIRSKLDSAILYSSLWSGQAQPVETSPVNESYQEQVLEQELIEQSPNTIVDRVLHWFNSPACSWNIHAPIFKPISKVHLVTGGGPRPTSPVYAAVLDTTTTGGDPGVCRSDVIAGQEHCQTKERVQEPEQKQEHEPGHEQLQEPETQEEQEEQVLVHEQEQEQEQENKMQSCS